MWSSFRKKLKIQVVQLAKQAVVIVRLDYWNARGSLSSSVEMAASTELCSLTIGHNQFPGKCPSSCTSVVRAATLSLSLLFESGCLKDVCVRDVCEMCVCESLPGNHTMQSDPS